VEHRAGATWFRIRFQPKQRLFWELVNSSNPGAPTKIGYGGARGAGKSKAGRDVMILLCLQHAEIDCLILRRTWKEVYKNHVVPMFREFPGLRVWWNESKKTLHFPNGSNLTFGYAEHKDDIFDFQGQEYAFILVEEATHFNEDELTFLETCNRWTKNPAILPKMLYTTNPGNVGHEYIKRVFKDRNFLENEVPADYAFIQAYGWDNVEWATPVFVRDAGITPLEWKSWTWERQQSFLKPFVNLYYEWTDQQRFEFFIARTDYGRKLNALKGQLRDAHLLGSWDSFVGQFFSEWNRRIHVVQPFQIPSWWERFTSFDWGFSSPACTLWHAVSPEGRVFTYREAYIKKRDTTWLAKYNIKLSLHEKLRYNVADPSAFNPDRGPSHAEVMALQGWQMIAGDNDRVHGWARMREWLAWETDDKGELTRPPMWQIFEATTDPRFVGLGCPNLIRTLPALPIDEHDPEDVDTNAEDHAPDSARYGLMTRPRVTLIPVDAMPDEYAEATRRADHNRQKN
jgi:phage terminase large subunit